MIGMSAQDFTNRHFTRDTLKATVFPLKRGCTVKSYERRIDEARGHDSEVLAIRTTFLYSMKSSGLYGQFKDNPDAIAAMGKALKMMMGGKHKGAFKGASVVLGNGIGTVKLKNGLFAVFPPSEFGQLEEGLEHATCWAKPAIVCVQNKVCVADAKMRIYTGEGVEIAAYGSHTSYETLGELTRILSKISRMSGGQYFESMTQTGV